MSALNIGTYFFAVTVLTRLCPPSSARFPRLNHQSRSLSPPVGNSCSVVKLPQARTRTTTLLESTPHSQPQFHPAPLGWRPGRSRPPLRASTLTTAEPQEARPAPSPARDLVKRKDFYPHGGKNPSSCSNEARAERWDGAGRALGRRGPERGRPRRGGPRRRAPPGRRPGGAARRGGPEGVAAGRRGGPGRRAPPGATAAPEGRGGGRGRGREGWVGCTGGRGRGRCPAGAAEQLPPGISRGMRYPRGRWRWPKCAHGGRPAGSGPVLCPDLPRDEVRFSSRRLRRNPPSGPQSLGKTRRVAGWLL